MPRKHSECASAGAVLWAAIGLCLLPAPAAGETTKGAEAVLARPTPQQVAWHDMEIEMFLCLDPCTWQDREYDNRSTPLAKINPTKLDTDQWARVAESMGAGQIVFVAKHTGGFCWWRTDTTNYGVKETPWRGGKGDVVADLAKSCRRRGIKLGIYLSPRDDVFGAGVGGRCKTKAAQKRYEGVYRKQLTELLSRYGEISEVWFDGSAVIEVGDILRKHAPKAMVFQGPHATIRWVGNEAGYAPYPAWNAVSKKDAESGVATARHGDPGGAVWLPNECDARIRSTWFWNSKNAHTLKSVEELMEMYYRSVGHGAVLLLNNTPDTTGLIPEADARRSAEFGAEIRRRFGKSLAGKPRGTGKVVEIDLGEPTWIDHVIAMEDIRQGERVREYVVEGLVDGAWQEISQGTAVGHKKIDRFAAVRAAKVRFRCLKSAATPVIRRFAVYDAEPEDAEVAKRLAKPTPQQAAWHDMELGCFIHFAPNTWRDSEYDDGRTPLKSVNPKKLDTDQWVRAAEAFGAKYIVFVAKHVGGFCMWRTDTTDYQIGNTPWRGGKGDVLADLAASCRKRGVKLGVYLSPQDRRHGAGVGGRCRTKAAQEKYNRMYRAQLTEVLTRYGEMVEVWFDGSNVVPVGDILEKHTPKAMVFQGPNATIRWVGNEAGHAPYPGWNSLSKKDATTGVATARHGNPRGGAWMPLECDARIRANWFWNTKNAPTLKGVDELMEMYYRSVGRGAVLLLNHTPDTSGLIPEADVKRAAGFGAEIRRRFSRPVAETEGRGSPVEMSLAKPALVDTVITMEDIRHGERVREYVIEGRAGGRWTQLCKGTAIGHKKIDRFSPVAVTAVRLRCLRSATTPRIRKLAAYSTGHAGKAGPFVGYWRMEEAGGNRIRDSLGRHKDAEVHGAVPAEGKSGKALRFDGRDDYVSLGNLGVLNRDFTIAAWIRPARQGDAVASPDRGGRGERFIVAKERHGVGAFQFRFYLGRDNRLGFMMSGAGGPGIWPFETKGRAVAPDAWSHVAVTRKARQFALYVNAQPVARKASAEAITHVNGLDLRIGGRYAPSGGAAGDVFSGLIDEVYLANRALTPKELSALKSGQAPAAPETPKRPKTPKADGYRVAGRWNASGVKADWSDLVIDITRHCDDAGQFEVVFRKTGGEGGLEIKAVSLILGQTEAAQYVERVKGTDTFYVNLPAVGQTAKLRALVRAKGPADTAGQVLIRRMPAR